MCLYPTSDHAEVLRVDYHANRYWVKDLDEKICDLLSEFFLNLASAGEPFYDSCELGKTDDLFTRDVTD